MGSLILGIAAVIAALFALAAAYVYGLFGRHLQGAPSFALPPARDETEIDRLATALVEGQAGKSGAVLIGDNIDAFSARAVSRPRTWQAC